MRRALAILKYVPALLCGLLVVAWVLSFYATFGVTVPASEEERLGASFHLCHFSLWTSLHQKETWFWSPHGPEHRDEAGVWLGRLTWGEQDWGVLIVRIPVCLLLTVLTPMALGCVIRVPLWSYFAWTALIAAELAYYLR